MSKIRIVTIGLALLLAVGGLTAFAQTGMGGGMGPGGKMAMGPGGMMKGPGFLARGLDLTDAQKEQAKTIFQTARQNAQAIQQQLKPLEQNLQEAIKANNVAGIQTAIGAMVPLRTQLAVIHATAAAQFYQLLTPEQKAKLDQARNRMKGAKDRMKNMMLKRKALRANKGNTL